jgi:hypothetical protein
MFPPVPRQINCPNCRQPFTAQIEQIIDGGRDPNAKNRFLSGRTNLQRCPYCGYEFRVATPIAYHDASKELFLVNIPMELGLPPTETERLMGNLTKAIMNSLPPEGRKGYLLMPRNTLTLQGMLDTILEADGITKEMIEARRNKLRLAETFLQTDPAQWPALAAQNDATIDEDFFNMITVSAEAAMTNGRPDVANALELLQQQLLTLTTVGQRIAAEEQAQEALAKEVIADLNGLGREITRDQIIDLAVRYAREAIPNKVQILAAVARRVMDSSFFQALQTRLESADEADKPVLEGLLNTLTGLMQVGDEEGQQVLQRAATFLQEVVNSEDVEAALRGNLQEISEQFLAVLSANLENAERTGNQPLAERLAQVMDVAMSILQESAPPQIRFLNRLLTAPTEDAADQILAEGTAEFGETLLTVMDAVIGEFAQSGNNAMAARIAQLRERAAAHLNGGDRSASGKIRPFPVRPGAGTQSQGAAPSAQDQAGGPNIPTPNPPASANRGAEDAPPVSDQPTSGIVLPFSARKRKKD